MTPVLVIVGPTGAGKSALAMALAAKLGGEIISCDSVQVYQAFDIGAAKPTSEERRTIPHHLLDVVRWDDGFDAAKYASQARSAMDGIRRRGSVPIVVGGTGLYLRALLEERWSADLPNSEDLRVRLRQWEGDRLWDLLWRLDPRRAWQVHPNDLFRVVRALEIVLLTGKPVGEMENSEFKAPGFETLKILVSPPRKILHERIHQRVQEMVKLGLIEEVQSLLDQGCDRNCKPMQSIGYKQVSLMLSGQLRREDLEEKIIFATRQYAKRQMTWFRRFTVDLTIETPQDIKTVLELIDSYGRRSPQRDFSTPGS